MTGTIQTFLDGRVQTVPADDPRLAEQQAQRHILNMRRLDLQGRRDYLANIERREGEVARARVADAFAADWQGRK